MRENNQQTWNRRKWLKSVSAVGAAGFAGCIGGSGGNQGDSGTAVSNGTSAGGSGEWSDFKGKELHFVTDASSDAGQKFWNRVASDFKKATGAQPNIEYVGIGTSSTERITQLLQAGNPPEIFSMNAGNAASFNSRDLLMPVNELIDSIENRIGKPSESATIEVNGKQWFVPLWITPGSYYYRNDVSDTVPNTWEKSLQYAKEVNEKSNKLQGVYVPAGSGAHVCYRIMGWMYSIGGSVCEWNNDRIEVAYNKGKNRKKMIRVLEFIKNRHKYSPTAADSDWTTWSNAIPTGGSASSLYLGFRPIIKSIQNNREFLDNVQMVPGMPKGPGPDGSQQTSTTVEGLGTFKGANTKVAKEFINFSLQKKYLTQLYMEIAPIHNIPAYPEYRSSNAYKEAIKDLPEEWPDKIIDEYQEKVNFKSLPADTQPPNPYAGSSYNSPPLWNMQTDLLVNDKSPEAVIDQYAPEHQNTIDEAQS